MENINCVNKRNSSQKYVRGLVSAVFLGGVSIGSITGCDDSNVRRYLENRENTQKNSEEISTLKETTLKNIVDIGAQEQRLHYLEQLVLDNNFSLDLSGDGRVDDVYKIGTSYFVRENGEFKNIGKIGDVIQKVVYDIVEGKDLGPKEQLERLLVDAQTHTSLTDSDITDNLLLRYNY